ncbi:hypothetical protein GCM10023336_77110 [Streptomyces similanensis]|uniref:DUF5133 domain-containing protein n=2 Tax=Streptomyces similanensis TaxID=1274988 RepID=A0ABP9LRT8_9ACTN
MLMPHPEFLRKLVHEYETALAEETMAAAAGRHTRSQDLAYTLCVSTGTRDVRSALETARRMLAAAAPAAERRVPTVREVVPAPRETAVPAAVLTGRTPATA